MFFVCKKKTSYEMRISDWSSDVCSSDLRRIDPGDVDAGRRAPAPQNRYRDAAGLRIGAAEAGGVAARAGLRQKALHRGRGARQRVRSEERRVGDVCVRNCRSRVSPDQSKKNIDITVYSTLQTQIS